MRCISTRGQTPVLNFEDVLPAGLASDGDLYAPEDLPRSVLEEIASWIGPSYRELTFRMIHPFVADNIADTDLKRILEKTYGVFAHDIVVPLRQLNGNEQVSELFHGPAPTFEDLTLQLLGRLLNHMLAKHGERVVIMRTTSGDTSSTAIEGCRRCNNVDIFIMYPHDRVPEVRRRQITTILSDNIHNIAIEGNFDDRRETVRANSADQGLLKGTRLVAVNSINWVRVIAQIVYYFHAALQLGASYRSVTLLVSTSNLGDILVGCLARNMDLPVSQLIVATNRNGILHRFVSGNYYDKDTLYPSLSPSMGIMVLSNFERPLFDLHGRNGKTVAELLDAFRASGKLSAKDQHWTEARKLFDSLAVSDEQTCETIAEVYRSYDELLGPHTTIGTRAARECRRSLSVLMVALDTAHPVGFPKAVEKVDIDQAPALPMHPIDLFGCEECRTVLPNELAKVQAFVS